MSGTAVASPGRERRRALRKVLSNPVTVAGLVVVGLFVASALLAPVLAPFPDHATGAPPGGSRLTPPGREHLFGTDTLGRDVFSRVLMGARLSLMLVVASVAGASTLGVLIGMVAGVAPRAVDETLMRLTDIFLSLPSLVLAMLVAITLGAGIPATIAAITLTYWPRYARLARGETLRYRAKPFIDAAFGLGVPGRRVVLRHILPNIAPTILVQASLDAGATMLTAASLGFLGLGARPPAPEWGSMVATGRELMPDFWWLSAFPGLAIFIVVIGLNLVGDGLRVAFDPQQRGEV